MFAVDTNVLLHALNRDAPEHEAARSLVEECRTGPERCCITWSIAYEFLRVATHPRVFPTPASLDEALGFLRAFLASPAVDVLVESRRHPAVLDDVAEDCPWASGNLLHDLHVAALLREHGVGEIRTADSDFRKFPSLGVVDPFAG